MDSEQRLWHVIVTVGGEPQDPDKIRVSLVRLLAERPFLHSVRFGERRAELQYWEESLDMVDAASLALRLWNEHRVTADLPDWKVVGLEVVDEETHKARGLSAPVKLIDVVPEPF